MSTVWSNVTIVQISFHSWKHGEIRLDGGLTPDLVRFAAGPGALTSLVNYSFEKQIGPPAGTFTCMLKGYAEGITVIPAGDANLPVAPNTPWLDLLEEGDWWTCVIEKNDEILQVGAGKIDTIQLSQEANKGETRTSVTVSGRDLGFGLQDVPVYFNPFDPAADNALGINMIEIVQGQGGPAEDVIRNMIRGMFGLLNTGSLFGSHIRIPPSLLNQVPARLETDVTTGDPFSPTEYYIHLIDLDTHVQDLEGQVFVPMPVLAADSSDSSVWEFVDTWRNAPLNEMFVDINPRETKPQGYLILRERPFVNVTDGTDNWAALPLALIDAGTVRAANLTKGQNRINHVLMLGDLTSVLGNESFGLHPPAVNYDSLERYGLKRLMERTNYYEDVGGAAAEAQLKSWRSRIVSWNALNHRYLQGTLVIGEARPDIRIGMRVGIVNGPMGGYTALPPGAQTPPTEVPEDALTFYVEGVRYHGSFGEQPVHQTEIKVARGYQDNKRLPDLLREYLLWQEQTATALGPLGSPNRARTLMQMSDEDVIALSPQIHFIAPSSESQS